MKEAPRFCQGRGGDCARQLCAPCNEVGSADGTKGTERGRAQAAPAAIPPVALPGPGARLPALAPPQGRACRAGAGAPALTPSATAWARQAEKQACGPRLRPRRVHAPVCSGSSLSLSHTRDLGVLVRPIHGVAVGSLVDRWRGNCRRGQHTHRQEGVPAPLTEADLPRVESDGAHDQLSAQLTSSTGHAAADGVITLLVTVTSITLKSSAPGVPSCVQAKSQTRGRESGLGRLEEVCLVCASSPGGLPPPTTPHWVCTEPASPLPCAKERSH